MTERVFYHADFSVGGCWAKVTLNGFPLLPPHVSPALPQAKNFAPPVNELLIGQDNQLRLEAHSVDLGGGAESTFRDLQWQGAVRCFRAAGGIFEPGEGGEVVATLGIPESLIEQDRDEPLPLPITISHTFNSEGASFRELFVQGATIDDREGLMDYAMTLRSRLAAKDADGLPPEFVPKLNAYAAGYQQAPSDEEAGFREFLQQQLLPAGPDVEFERDQVELVSWCDGRVWELKRTDGRPLLLAGPDQQGATFAIPVFVGLVDGQLKVVR